MKKTITILLFAICLLNVSCGTNKNGFILTTDKNELTVEVKKEQEEVSSFGDKTYIFFKDFGVIILSAFGLLIGGKLLSRKLLENHISTALSDIQNSNKETLKQSVKLLDDIVSQVQFDRSNTLNKETAEIIEDLLIKVNDLYLVSQTGSSECQTLLFYLKQTLQDVLNLIKNSGVPIIMSNQDIFSLTRNTVESVTFIATRVVPVPKSGKTISEELITKDLRRYVNNSKYKRYKHFNQGVVFDQNSALFLMFYVINFNSNATIKRSMFKIHWSVPPVTTMMYKSKIYAPPIIQWKNIESDSIFTLYLIGYKPDQKTYFNDGKIEFHTDLFYTNPIDNVVVIDAIIKKNNLSDYKDAFINDTNFRFVSSDKVIKNSFETIQIKADTMNLFDAHRKNKRKIKKLINPRNK
jgi:hypothetical protein